MFFYNCETIKTNGVGLCYKCEDYPCKRLSQLDEKHRTRHNISMIENLEYIKEHGMGKFLEKEEEKWRCPECGGLICMAPRNVICFSCGLEKLRSKRNPHRWEDE